MAQFGCDVVSVCDALQLGGGPITHEQLTTSGDLERAGLRVHDFKLCPCCGGGVLTGHERRKDNGFVIARVWCRGCNLGIRCTVEFVDQIEAADAILRERWNKRVRQDGA